MTEAIMNINQIKQSQRRLVISGTEGYDNGYWKIEIYGILNDLEFEYKIKDSDSEKDYTFEEFIAEALVKYDEALKASYEKFSEKVI